jgi:hypothetical protein
MNPVTSLILSVALLLGGAGAVFAFESAANLGSAQPAVSAEVAPAPTATAGHVRPTGHHGNRHRTVVRWAHCGNGARLENGVCVTDVVRTLILPAPAAPAVSHGSSTSASAHGGGSGERGDDHGDHEHEAGDD